MRTLTEFNVENTGALETAEAVRRGGISALEVCDAAIARIEARDEDINAVVVRDFDRARAAAKAIDGAGTKGDPRPLLGVAMTVKESNNVAGLPTTWGMERFKDFRPEIDGPPVARLKAAGAVILGKTNAPVALADWQTVNPIYGRTVNPYDHARSPGGSSGGAAAALATRMVPLELGSDIGGSIRIPCHMCGVFGHKPTYGVVPLKGHDFPGTDGVDAPLAVVGPMARHARDVAAALDVVAGPWPEKGWRLDLPASRHQQLKDFRVLVIDTYPDAGADEAVTGPIHALAAALEKLGAQVQYKSDALPDLGAAHVTYVQYLMNVISRGTPEAQPMSAHQMMDIQDMQFALQRHWEKVFRDVDVILAPAFGVPAFPHDDHPDWADRVLTIGNAATPYSAQLAWAGLATFPGLPSTAAPLGLTSAGLPTGVQIIGDLYDDRTTLAFAELLEREGLAAAPTPPL